MIRVQERHFQGKLHASFQVAACLGQVRLRWGTQGLGASRLQCRCFQKASIKLVLHEDSIKPWQNCSEEREEILEYVCGRTYLRIVFRSFPANLLGGDDESWPG